MPTLIENTVVSHTITTIMPLSLCLHLLILLKATLPAQSRKQSRSRRGILAPERVPFSAFNIALRRDTLLFVTELDFEPLKNT